MRFINMGLYKLYSNNVEIQYKSYFFSKAMFFTLILNVLNITLPFIIAYRSRGFWLNTNYFYEKPIVRPTFDYLLLAESNDASASFICGDTNFINNKDTDWEEYCKEVQIQEQNGILNFKLQLNVPSENSIASITLLVGLDFYLMTICPLQMQSLAVISQNFAVPSHGLKYHGHLEFYQTSHLSCLRHHIDTTYNESLFYYQVESNKNPMDDMLNKYFSREVTSQVKTIYARNQIGSTGTFEIDFYLKIPQVKVLYTPSLLQELKWAWPQYLSLVVIFYWIFNKIKLFVFSNRLLMAWEIIPWKKLNNFK